MTINIRVDESDTEEKATARMRGAAKFYVGAKSGDRHRSTRTYNRGLKQRRWVETELQNQLSYDLCI